MSIETPHRSTSELSNSKKPALPPKPKLSLAENRNPSLEQTNSDNSSYNALINSLREKLNIKTNGSGSDSSLALSTLSSNSEATELKSLCLNSKMNDLSLLDEIYAEIEDKYLFQRPRNVELNTIQGSCSCSHSSQSSQSSCSCSYLSESADRPPLPSVPPPNLVNSDPGDRRASMSLEEEIALEIRAKLNQEYVVSAKVEAQLDPIDDQASKEVDKMPDTPVLEPEYLEPILITKADKNRNDKGFSKMLSNQASPKVNSDFILSPSKLKSYLIRSPKSPQMDTNQSKAFGYLLKKSNRITSTLRLIRTKSSSNNVNNQSIYSQPVEQKFYQSNVNISAEPTQVEISRPTLISQTFDLNKQSLIEIKNESEAVRSSSSFNSSFDASSTSSVYSPKTEYEPNYDHSTNEAIKKFNTDHSPTIESNLIITNVYEEDDLIATHQQTKHNTNTNNSSNHYASNSVINKPLPTVPSSNVNSRQSNKENGPSNSVNNLQNHKKVLENFFSSSSNSSSVSTPSSVSSANGQAVNSKSNDTNKSKANGEMKKMAPPVPPPRQDLSRDDTMLNKCNTNLNIYHYGKAKPLSANSNHKSMNSINLVSNHNSVYFNFVNLKNNFDNSNRKSLNYHGQNQIPAFSKPVRAPSPSSTGATPQFPTTNKPPPPPPAPMSQQQQHPPLPPTPAQAPPLPPYNRNMTKPLNVAPPPPPPPVAPPPIPDKYSHHPPPPPPPNQPPPPPPPSRPAPPRPPPQPPTKSIDDLERRFQFLPLPGSADLPRVFSPPNDREYPSAKYEVKMRSNGNH